MKLIAAVAGFVAIGQVGANVEAQTTRVNVRVVSHDAKIIGTGSTATIVVEPHGRGERVYESEGAALFTARLELDVSVDEEPSHPTPDEPRKPRTPAQPPDLGFPTTPPEC